MAGRGSGWSGGCRWGATRRRGRGPSTWWPRRAPGSAAAARSCGAPTCPSWRSGASSHRAATAASTPAGTPAARWLSRWSASLRRTPRSPRSSSASSPPRSRSCSASTTPTSSRLLQHVRNHQCSVSSPSSWQGVPLGNIYIGKSLIRFPSK
uniref:Uncharacterized protein n=1 Tax=Arundo donax TaxID=35708 RepID=A0A0A9E467_ARUDO